jgi:hypothetical protein
MIKEKEAKKKSILFLAHATYLIPINDWYPMFQHDTISTADTLYTTCRRKLWNQFMLRRNKLWRFKNITLLSNK